MSRVMKQAVFPPGWRINCLKHNRSTVGGNFIMSPITPGTDKQKPHPVRRLIPPRAGMTDQVGLQRLPNRTGIWCVYLSSTSLIDLVNSGVTIRAIYNPVGNSRPWSSRPFQTIR